MDKSLVIAGLLAVTLGIAFFGTAIFDSGLDENKEADIAFAHFMTKFDRRYLSQNDLEYRLKVFKGNFRLIQTHNADKSQTFRLAVNQFADMTLTEMKQYTWSGFDHQAAQKRVAKCPVEVQSVVDPEPKMDWQAKGVVSPVKNQKNCGSCWAFSATGALESAVAIKTAQPPLDLSEQELVDCTGPQGNKGCKGGFMNLAYDYILEKGINLSKDYPYKAWTHKCKEDLSGKGAVRMTDCVRQVPSVDGLVQLIARGPVAAAVFADILMFFYNEGVFDIPAKMCDQEVDHGVLAVGYDLTAETPYFIVKNSWGEKWGEKGYFKIAMGKGTGLCRLSGSGLNYLPVV